VICVPDLAVHRRTAEDRLLLLACDGVLDVMSTAEAVEFAGRVLAEEGLGGPEVAAGELVDLALSLESTDNISVILVPLTGTTIAGKKRMLSR
jgi:serine/threonine protein phosphatase PrpC